MIVWIRILLHLFDFQFTVIRLLPSMNYRIRSLNKLTQPFYEWRLHSLLLICAASEHPEWERSPNEKYADSHSSVTTEDYGVKYERMEALQEYLESGTWDVDTSWSEEARALQKIAVIDPRKITGKDGEKFILDYFRSLKMVDKEVNRVDADMTLLRRLKNLTLSVNQLADVPSENLPKKLKVLELCTNHLRSVTSLCKKPPPLQHLGLSYNFLHSVEEYKYFTVNFWPHLLSLDLSYNNLDQLVALVDSLSTLPKLRSLALNGNPLSLVPGYRGYVLDSLRNLMIFDDVHVSEEDKHRFKGLARRKENIRNEAHFIVSINTLGGVPVPEELKDLEDREEFPIVTSQYLIRYEMLKKRSEALPDELDGGVSSNDEELFEFESELNNWSNWIEFDYKKHHVISNLGHFRDFLRRGMRIQVVCKKCKSWPVEESPTGEGSPDLGRKSGLKKEGKPKKKSAKDKGKKKTGDVDVELRSDPPVYEDIGTQHISLSFLLDGVNVIEDMLYCGGGPMSSPDEVRKLREMEKLQADEVGKSASKKKTQATSAKRTASAKTRNPSGGAKGKGKVEVEEEDPVIPKPITLEVKLELKRWHTAMDSQQDG